MQSSWGGLEYEAARDRRDEVAANAVTLSGERTLRITWVLLKRLAITEIGMNQWGASKKSEKLQQLRA